MTIKIYPSQMQGEPIEQHECEGCTIGQFLNRMGAAYHGRTYQPIVVLSNGREIPVDEWADYEVEVDDDVEIRILPQGGVFGAIGSIIGAVFDFALGWLIPGAPEVNTTQTQQGADLETANASANAAKLGAVVPETAGRFRRYPDYLTPPRRYYAGPRDQRLEFLCCLGPGEYQVLEDDRKIGDTPVSALGDDAECLIFPPGADVSVVTAHEHWHSVEEVGGTSSGTAGLELSSVYSSEVNPTAASYTINNRTITIAPADGAFPAGWGVGTVIDIRLPQTFAVSTFSSEAVTPRNRFTGNFREAAPGIGTVLGADGVLNPTMQYTVSGANIGPDGVGWVELSYDVGGGPEVVTGIPDGERTITFWRLDRRYVVDTYTEQAVTLSAFNGGGIEAGWAGFPATVSTTVAITTDQTTVYGDWTSAFVACPPNETTATLELDFSFPQGLAHIANNGGLEARTVQVEIQYRDHEAGGPYESVTKTYVEATLDQIGFSERIELDPPIRPEVRVRRLGAASTSTQDQDEVQWSGLKSNLPTRTSYPNWTTCALSLRGGGRLAARSENKFNVVQTRILPVLLEDGTWGNPQPTREISAFVRYIARSIGYTDDQLDAPEFVRLEAIWRLRADTLDYIYDQTTVADAIRTALIPGMAEMTINDGLIRPVRDDVRTTFDHPYSTQNMQDGLTRAFRSRRIDDTDGVEVEFIDGTTWAKNVVRCLLPEDQGFKILKVKLDGVTDRTKAWRIGMRRRRALRYRNWQYSFQTELDALNSDYMDYVALVDDVPGYGQSAIMVSATALGSAAVVVSSEPLVWYEDREHVMAWRRPDGRLAGPFAATRGPDDYSAIVAATEPLPNITLSMEPPHVFFGNIEKWTFPALVTGITPNALESVSVEATNYHPLVYSDDNSTPPPDA